MLLCSVGDLLLDVIVRLERPLAAGDDTRATTQLAPGGQAANVAAWATALGAQARLVCRRGDDEAGRLLWADLAARGVELVGPVGGRTGAVVSLVEPGGERSLVSDRAGELGEIKPVWLEGADVLHVSGYALTESVASAAKAVPRVSLDLGAVSLLDDGFRERAERLRPDVVFATEAERQALGAELAATWIVKHGAAGVAVDGRRYPAPAARAVDTTGAGDALAAGFLVGGIELGLEAAARCVAQPGAMP